MSISNQGMSFIETHDMLHFMEESTALIDRPTTPEWPHDWIRETCASLIMFIMSDSFGASHAVPFYE
jgi:hypothetical protein